MSEIDLARETRRRIRNLFSVLAVAVAFGAACAMYFDSARVVGPELCRGMIERGIIAFFPEARIADRMKVTELEDGSYLVGATVVYAEGSDPVRCRLVRVDGGWMTSFYDVAP